MPVDDMSNWLRVPQVVSGSSCCAGDKYAAAVTPREPMFTKRGEDLSG